MKKIILPVSFALLLSGCSFFNSQSTSKTSSSRSITAGDDPYIGHSYEEVSDKTISWSNLFEQESNLYYVYFYSPYCGHCSDFKDTIIPYALETEKDFYFCKESDDFMYVEDASNTIGVTSIEDFRIVAFPSLVVFNEHKVTVNISGTGAISKLLNL